jgi:hypothetical protein
LLILKDMTALEEGKMALNVSHSIIIETAVGETLALVLSLE